LLPTVILHPPSVAISAVGEDWVRIKIRKVYSLEYTKIPKVFVTSRTMTSGVTYRVTDATISTLTMVLDDIIATH
jgi:hypothetical protein